MEMHHESEEIRKVGSSSWISWGAVFGGLVSGMSSYLLLALLGLAVGLAAVNPQSAEPVGRVPMMTGIWTGISMILSAFIGGYVTTRMSGLSRRTDGILHGFVAWGVSTLFFAYLITTSVGSVIGGAFSALGQGVKAAGGTTAGAIGAVASSPDAKSKLESLVTGSGGAKMSKESAEKLQARLSAGDRDGAISLMVKDMGFTRDRATTVVDNGMTLFGTAKEKAGQVPEQSQQMATSAVSGLKTAFLWLFAGVLLSMALSMGGGAFGAKAVAKRRMPLAH